METKYVADKIEQEISDIKAKGVLLIEEDGQLTDDGINMLSKCSKLLTLSKLSIKLVVGECNCVESMPKTEIVYEVGITYCDNCHKKINAV